MFRDAAADATCAAASSAAASAGKRLGEKSVRRGDPMSKLGEMDDIFNGI